MVKDPLPTWSEPSNITNWGNECDPPIEKPWLGYLNYHAQPEMIIAIGRLLFPTFIEYSGGVFLEMNFSESGFHDWQKKIKAIEKIETVMNHVHVYDLFITDNEIDEASFEAVGNLLSHTWQAALQKCFPNRSFKVSISNTEQDYGPVVSFHSNRTK